MTDQEFMENAYKFQICLDIQRIIVNQYKKSGLAYKLHQYCDQDTLENIYKALLNLETYMNE